MNKKEGEDDIVSYITNIFNYGFLQKYFLTVVSEDIYGYS